MNTTLHPRLSSILPSLAAQIDTERPLLARAFAEFITVEIPADGPEGPIQLHCADKETFDLLQIPSQKAAIQDAFNTHGFLGYTILCTKPETQLATGIRRLSKRTANALTFLERDALRQWMQLPDPFHYVAHKSDADAARFASGALSPLTITSGNIASMRKLLGIEKVKPEKPQPAQLPDGLTLSDLQSRLQAHEERLDDLRVQGTGMQATLADFHRCLSVIVAHINTSVTPLDPVRGPGWMPSSPSGQSSQ